MNSKCDPEGVGINYLLYTIGLINREGPPSRYGFMYDRVAQLFTLGLPNSSSAAVASKHQNGLAIFTTFLQYCATCMVNRKYNMGVQARSRSL